jgi:hypothetical protein
MDKNTIFRISELKGKIINQTATQAERDEYVEILHDNKRLYDSLYESYKKNEYVEDVLKACVIIGGIIILGLKLNEATKDVKISLN